MRPSDSLVWEIEESAEPIFWEFDLGWELDPFPFLDSLHFAALQLGLSQFATQVWPKYREKSVGALLYRGDIPPCCSVDEREQLALYLQMLSHALPDDLPLFLHFRGGQGGSWTRTHQFLSGEAFPYFSLLVENVPHWRGALWKGDGWIQPFLPERALCLPTDPYCKEDVVATLDRWMGKAPWPFRVIPEMFLTEEWEGVDTLYYLPSAVSEQGKRKLSGFLAAGGEAVEIEP